MHPFFTQPGRLGVYLLGWIPLTAILGGLLMLAGGLSLLEAAALAAPLGLLYAFLCLSSWYLCRAFPVDSARLLATASALAVASLVAASLWLLSGTTLAWVLALLPVFETLPDRLAHAGPVVFLLGVLLYLLVLAMHYVLEAAEAARSQERRAAELRTMAREAELQALRERLNPHFLFNSLNSIAALVAVRPEEARSMCALLSDFLRTTLGMSERASIPLFEELALAHRYLAVERVRFGDRLTVAEDFDPAADGALVPPLLLQPLVENAVKHGIAGRLEGGTLTIVTKRFGDRVTIVVENPADANAPKKEGTGLGLANVARRVEASWGAAGRFAASRIDSRFRAEIELPAGL
ncbi:MAG: histidine kinase [Thermoanaerobaculia bacterium]|nr:histidine kinase [Thermoanaerobaculia bacterium]